MQELFRSGGPVMWPLLALSILSVGAIAERLWFWVDLLRQEEQTVGQIISTAAEDINGAAELAKQASNTPIGRFLYAPLALKQADPELFRLALESTADDELVNMLRGEKLFESVIALSPLLGLLGTVIGLIASFSAIKIGDLANSLKTGNLTEGIGQALISTAAGLTVAIATLAFHRLFLALHANQVKLFRKAGNDLELIYRQYWQHREGK